MKLSNLQDTAHELRGPITVIRGFAEILRDTPDLSSQTIKEVSEKIVQTSHRLENIIACLLTESSLQQVDLLEIAQRAQQFAASTYPSAAISLQSTLSSAPIIGDPHLLDIVIMNLIDNGVQYSSSPAHVQISVQQKDSWVLLQVQDRGMGIGEVDLPHIFDRFYRIHPEKGKGLGIGLSLVKTIVTQHSANIAVTSQIGGGATFTISFLKRI